MQNVYKSIRGDRAALRTLVERYGGAAYALAYSETKSFPRAQRVALRAWPRVAEKLPHLARTTGQGFNGKLAQHSQDWKGASAPRIAKSVGRLPQA